MTKTKIDPLFAEHARTAPRLDLQRYVDYASRHDREFSAATLAIVNDMVALYVALSRGTVKGTPAAHKRAVWTLIGRFKASIDGWSGNAGSPEFGRLTSDEWLAANGLTPDVNDEPIAEVA